MYSFTIVDFYAVPNAFYGEMKRSHSQDSVQEV